MCAPVSVSNQSHELGCSGREARAEKVRWRPAFYNTYDCKHHSIVAIKLRTHFTIFSVGRAWVHITQLNLARLQKHLRLTTNNHE